jgi:hypothetical protein
MESRNERCGVAESPITNDSEGRREQAMRKVLTITLVAALALFAGSAAYANYCARDVVPASTILVPYVVNDMLDNYTPDPAGYTTLLTITNVSREAQIIHITVWNAVSTACLDFNEVLSGYDMWQINFRDMIKGDFAQFDTDQISTAAPNIDPDGNGPLQRAPFEWGPDGRSSYAPLTLAGLPVPEKTNQTLTTDCEMPYGQVQVSTNVDCLRAPLTARTHYGCDHQSNTIINQTKKFNIRGKFNNDWLSKITADPLWYYVTVDVINQCNFLFPNDQGYFQNFYVNENVLIGDIVYLSSRDNFSEAINAVHIETDSNGVGLFNFYQEKANTSDLNYLYTEPLATALAFDYYNGFKGAFSSVMMWKNFTEFRADGKVDDCAAYLYYAWDQDEHVITRQGSCQVSPCSVNEIDPNEFPFETQKVPITTDNFDLPATAGWMLVIFPPSYGAGYTTAWDPTNPSGNGTPPTGFFVRPYMAWAAVQFNYGTYSSGIEAATLANAHCFRTQVQPQLGVNFDSYPLPTE